MILNIHFKVKARKHREKKKVAFVIVAECQCPAEFKYAFLPIRKPGQETEKKNQ